MHIKRTIFAAIILSVSVLAFLSSAALASNETRSYEVELPATVNPSLDYSTITTVVGNYFTCYYQSLEQLDTPVELENYIVDTDETHLYLRALQYGIDWRRELNTGIADAKLERVDIKYAKAGSDGSIDVIAYVKVGFRYLGDQSRTMTGLGDLWEIGLDNVDGQLKIVSLNSEASDYHYAKKLVAENMKSHATTASGEALGEEKAAATSVGYTKKDAVDDAYSVIQTRIARVKEQLSEAAEPSVGVAVAEPSVDIEAGTAAPASTTSLISHSRDRSGLFANWKGYDYDTLIFHRQSPDCTNFVSQCLWIGYGGDQQPADPFSWWYYDPGVTTCRNLAYANFRQIGGSSGWWGKSQKYGWGYASGPWMRVLELWGYVQLTNQGPRGTHVNNKQLYSVCNTTVRRGYVLQFSPTATDNGYFHSACVVSGDYALKYPANIFIGQHSGDNGYRQLLDCIMENGEYVRMLAMTTGSFPS